ncbi:MAG TPA: aldo/keto reductase [Gemmatimonadales bacterium]|nr:aldo/keto reductase [Gemmatimonadales bacterium]
MSTPTRRDALRAMTSAGIACLGMPSGPRFQAQQQVLTRAIPSSGEKLPAVGLGSWITFNVGDDLPARNACADVVRAFVQAGGRVIDSSPMYGSSQAVIGYALARDGLPSQVFAADKVWTSSDSGGRAQLEASRRLWGVPRFDLAQVHNLLNWESHLPLLRAMKSAGQVRYIGVTTSEGRRHDAIERLMRSEPLDFVQVSYNMVDREVEERILPLARDRGIAVVINRPFRQGALIDALRGRPLPAWASEIRCTSWAQVGLKFILSHPAVTCTIPATRNATHVRENLAAAIEPLPDATLRERIASHVARL